MAVAVVALAGHSLLAKVVYAYPPAGVGPAEARSGALLMYYAGDLIDVALITILCAQWYRHAGRRLVREPGASGLTSAP